MPTPLVAAASAVVVALGGVGVGSVMMDKGGTSSAAASKVPLLAADPTGRPAHSRFVYTPPGAQHSLPATGPIQGQAPGAGAAPGDGAPYVAHGQPREALGRVPPPAPTVQASTWKVYLSGGDLLQPDPGIAVQTNQSVGPSFGDGCSPGLSNRWQAPATVQIPLHGTTPGLLHVQASGTVPLTLSLIVSSLGGSCSVLSTTSAAATGTQAVSFTLPRVDVTLPEGVNLGFVVSASGSAKVTSTSAAPSYLILPTSPK
jgi:hypothetical protein